MKIEAAPEGRTLNAMPEAGEIDAFIGPRTPSCFEQGKPNIGWLLADPMAAAEGSLRRTGLFPIMHIIGVRRSLVDAHPWLPAAVLEAFTRAKKVCLERLEDTSASKVMLPFMDEQVKAARDLMGADFWPYGIPDEPQAARILLRPAPQAGPVLAGGEAGGAVSPDDVRGRTALGRHRDPHPWRSGRGPRLEGWRRGD